MKNMEKATEEHNSKKSNLQFFEHLARSIFLEINEGFNGN
jgi:hypothetical protein